MTEILDEQGRDQCPDRGRLIQTLERVMGGVQEVIITSAGRRISMTAIDLHDRIFDRLRQFQFLQETPVRPGSQFAPKLSFTAQGNRAFETRMKQWGTISDCRCAIRT